MKTIKILAIGDNVADKYLSRSMMYPGGQSFNTAVYTKMNRMDSAYLGKFGSDVIAEHNCDVLKTFGVDYSRSRFFEGENGYARVTLQDNDRVFLGSNKGGVAKEHPYAFTEQDLAYMKEFSLIYTNLNSYIEEDLPFLQQSGVPIVYDFSTRWDDAYLRKVVPFITLGVLSCAHLSASEREREMRKVIELGASMVVGTVGEAGSYILYRGAFLHQPAVPAEAVKDTMGAGDSYLSAFLVSLLQSTKGRFLAKPDAEIETHIQDAMRAGAVFAAKVCGMEGAFGHGIPLV
ncbi:fructoselysine 6-kinase [Selenomonas sp. TAMA-11512]|uniref:fructoselysine 6-kinase n=1 Tax=Selenomonas sp. TAMA-11512 TaxID=3095337 RepID=UPI003085CD03|nr:fructoselysine 6-kinase [Selenomonas sp. TAMA-11512]